jgi:hypothetical protein
MVARTVSLLVFFVALAAAQMPGMGKKEEPPKIPAVKSDIPYIKCQVSAVCASKEGSSCPHRHL